MVLLKSIARKLAETQFGQNSLAKKDGIQFLRQKPGIRVYIGFGLMAMSYLIGLPVMAILGYASMKLGKPSMVVMGGLFVFILVHILFGMGVYLAGKNYIKEVLYWATGRFLEKYTG